MVVEVSGRRLNIAGSCDNYMRLVTMGTTTLIVSKVNIHFVIIITIIISEHQLGITMARFAWRHLSSFYLSNCC